MSSDTEYQDSLVQLLEEGKQQQAKRAAPKGMAKPADPPAAVFKPDEARQALFPYSHEALVAFAIENPGASPLKLAQHFGQTPGWLASMVATDEFQRVLDPARPQVYSLFLTATLEERFRGLTLRSLEVLQTKLDDPKVQDATVLKAAEIGIKALGLGKEKDDEKPKVSSLDKLAAALEATLDAKGGRMIESRPGQGGLDDDDEPGTLVQDLKEVPNA